MNSPKRPGPRVTPATKKGGLVAAVLAILGTVFVLEGGYVDHPNDPGGATNHGITERVARDHGFEGDMRELERYCDFELSSSEGVDEEGNPTEPVDVCASSILFESYIKAPGYLPLVQIDPVVAEEVIDTAVNMGPSRPSRYFQHAVNEVCGTSLALDGRLGRLTWGAWRDCRYNVGRDACLAVLERLDAQQEAEYDRLVSRNPSLRVFRRGWQNHRIGNVDRNRCGELIPFEPVT